MFKFILIISVLAPQGNSKVFRVGEEFDTLQSCREVAQLVISGIDLQRLSGKTQNYVNGFLCKKVEVTNG